MIDKKPASPLPDAYLDQFRAVLSAMTSGEQKVEPEEIWWFRPDDANLSAAENLERMKRGK